MTPMSYDDKKFIGKTIQILRKKAKLKQSELAEKIGLSDKHLSKIETGKNFPSLDTYLKIADVLKFSLEDFGITSKSMPENEHKKALLKIIYSATDYETFAYLEIINTFNKINKAKNKKI